MSDLTVFYEATPNPQAMKFITATPICGETVHFTSATETTRSPLARKIFGFPWAAGVLIGPNFVTVTKQDWVDWTVLAEPLSGLIKEHIESGQPVLLAGDDVSRSSDSEESPSDSPVVRQIKQILREEIRPAVAMDGGDIAFDRFEDGRVYLHMQGACSGCPSSSATLKDGIETRLRSAIPEVLEVVQV